MSDSHGGGGLPGLGIAQGIHHKLHDQGYHMRAKPLMVIFVVLNIIFLFFSPSQTLANWTLVAFFSPLWVPYIMTRAAFTRYVQSTRAGFIFKQKYVLLELRMPRDSKKTPLAMEAILSSFNIASGETTWYKRFILGTLRPTFSLEIVSLGGRVHFYLWTRESLRRGIESFFYAQYPDMEIIEAEDYSLLINPNDHHVNSMFGNEFIHTKPDPYPIKTYVDYGLDKAGAKPEEVTDPMAQLIELFGSIGPKEQLWLQFVIRSTGGEKHGKLNKDGKPYTWRDEAQDEIEKIRALAVRKTTRTDPVTGATSESETFPNPTKGQSEMINAIERNASKQAFDVGIRSIYVAPNESFQGSMITLILNAMFKPFNNESYNGIKLSADFSAGFNDYPWEDVGGHHKHHLEEALVNFYRRRIFFTEPYIGPWVVMSTEELATLYHVPGANIETPGLPRIQSATSGAPANLPT
ncbi:hypothetical protein BH11PAT2_BH11PAT2_09740 [soil metagenome]